jgi:hypothetical protein
MPIISGEEMMSLKNGSKDFRTGINYQLNPNVQFDWIRKDRNFSLR